MNDALYPHVSLEFYGRVQAMTKIPYEIPAEIRDLTAKSVEDARKAFESFIEAAHKATAQAEGTTNALQSTSAKALSFTEANLKAAFDHAQKLFQAKDPREILAHQSEYVKKQLAAMEEHAINPMATPRQSVVTA
jgi:phasin